MLGSVQQQYFVGATDDRVAIFQGVQGELLGIPLHQVAEDTDIALTDLPESDFVLVVQGIASSDGLPGARGVVERLRSRMLPPCPAAQPEQPSEVPVPTLPGLTYPDFGTTPLPGTPPEPGVNCRPVA